MPHELRQLLLWALLTTAANLAGLYLVRARPEATRRRVLGFTAFGGGIVIGASLLHLLPEALKLRGDAGLYASVAFLGLYFFESHVRHRHAGGLAHATAHGVLRHGLMPHEHPHAWVDLHARTLALVTSLAFALHSITDGFALAVTYHEVGELGLVTGAAVLAHEAPEGIVVFTLLLHGGLSIRAATLYAWFVALITPVVALATYFTLGEVPPETLGTLLGLVSGSFLYIGATDLLPELMRTPRARRSAAVMAGFAIPLLLKLLHGGA